MHLIFGNPAGWWALLGLPALLLIHFLQRKSRRVEVSTLFLLERQNVQSRAGRRLEKWRNSLLFWLQVLAILLLAWMLSEPRWVETGTLQRVALVMDSSLSMEAFRADIEQGLDRDTATLARGAARTEWVLLESDLARPSLYRGEDRAALLNALAGWRPDLGPHDPTAALRAASVAVGNDGLVFFVTDRLPANPLPVEVHTLAYGRPLDNVGVAAATAEMHEGQPLWRVLVRNYAKVAQQRKWWFESGGQNSPVQTVNLAPGETVALQGAFPPNADRIVFALEPDAFTLDDRIPLMLPQAKPLTITESGPEDFVASLKGVRDMLADTTPGVNGGADVDFALGHELSPPLGGSQIFFDQVVDSSANLTRAHPAPEPGPLMDELNWSGLLYQMVTPLANQPDDTILLWDGATPLIFLRTESGGGQSLVCNFDPRHSNATHLPAFVLLMDRFIEEVRRRKAAPERANFLAGQSLRLVLPDTARGARLEVFPAETGNVSAARTVDLKPAIAAQAQAPSPPGFFTVKVDGQTWLDGAAQFPDPRESDFQNATAIPRDARAQVAREESHSHLDSLTPVWLLALLGALLWSWREAGKK
jgi:hypothetical protein